MGTILVLEKDHNLNSLVCDYLNNNGFQAVGCLCAGEAFSEICNKSYELIVADVVPPDNDVFQLIQTIRTFSIDTPILFIAERDGWADRDIAFRLGMDDYMDKPLVLEELQMRIRAILRRFDGETERTIKAGDLELDPERGSIFVNGKVVMLPTIEFNILYKLLSYPGRALSRAQLMAEVWGIDSDANVRLVDAYICRLRRKFSQYHGFRIVSIRKRGYMALPTVYNQSGRRENEVAE